MARQSWQRKSRWLLACISLAAAGCSPTVNTVPVRGTITYKGKPVEGAAVSFDSVGLGQLVIGYTDASGQFELTTLAGPTRGDGAPIGKYSVTIVKGERVDMLAKMGMDGPPKGIPHPDTVSRKGGYAVLPKLDWNSMKGMKGPGSFKMDKSLQAKIGKNLLPQKYASSESTPIRVEVTMDQSKNVFAWELTND